MSMSMSMIPTKTFKQYLVENPSLYDGIEIDDSTKQALFDWFELRFICDDDNFSRFFRRNLNLNLARYNKALRLETAEVDWFVFNYSEKLIDFSSNETNSNTRNLKAKDTETEDLTQVRTPNLTEKNGGSRTITRTPNLETSEEYTDNIADTGTTTTDLNRTTTITDTGNSTGESEYNSNSTSTGNSNDKNLTSSLPNSISFGGSETVENSFPNFNWKTASGMNETKATNNSTDSSESNASSSSTSSSNSNTVDAGTTTTTNDLAKETNGSKTTTQTGNEQEVLEDATTKAYSGSENIKGDNLKIFESNRDENITDSRELTHSTKDIETGRTGESPASVIKESVKVIYNTSAFEWLKEQLEVCFWQQIDLGGLLWN